MADVVFWRQSFGVDTSGASRAAAPIRSVLAQALQRHRQIKPKERAFRRD